MWSGACRWMKPVCFSFPCSRISSRARIQVFSIGTPPLVGAFTLCALAGHGALYLVWKTTGPVQARSRTWARRAWLALLPLWALVSLATVRVRPEIFTHLLARPWFLGFVVLMLAGVVGVFILLRAGRVV